MTKPTNSLTTLLERTEGGLQTADGRTVRVCRDPSGSCWVVDSAERVVPLAEFAVQCRLAAHEYRARARAEEMRRLVDMMKGILARVAKRLQRISARIAHA